MELEIYGSKLLIYCDEMVNQVGRIIMPEKHSERSRTATVVLAGDNVKNFAVGDRVLISWYTGVHTHLVGKFIGGVEVDEDRHRFVREEEILAKITSE